MEESIQAVFEKEKVTPGTIRFKEVTAPGARGVVGSIYVLKSELEKIGNPDRINVTIKPV
jgi:hypothetical protein